MRILAFLTTAVSVVTLASCSVQGPVVPLAETGASVEGTLYYGDQPVPFCMVILAQAGPAGGGAQSLTDDSGKFKINNVPLGQVKVGANSEAGKGMMMSRAMAGTDPTAQGGKKAVMPKMVEIPRKYQDPMNSGVTLFIEKGVNKQDIKLAK